MPDARSHVSQKVRKPAQRKKPPMTEADLDAHREPLIRIIRGVEAMVAQEGVRTFRAEELRPLLRRFPRSGQGFFSRSELISAFRRWSNEFELTEAEFAVCLRSRPVRTMSGVVPVTVLTQPFPCPGQCVFCPNDVRMPKSYLSDEPGAQRAEDNHFDPYAQTYNRLMVFRSLGHPTDKIELIVLGGTWSFYPESYQRWFIKRCFDALNDFAPRGANHKFLRPAANLPRFDALPRLVDGRTVVDQTYNRYVQNLLRKQRTNTELTTTWTDLEQAHQRNETADSRCVGLVLETRPDYIDRNEVIRLRRLGCTKVQLGVQSLSGPVLSVNKRGHDVATSQRALFLLRAAGFKVLAHWMPNLLGATLEGDIQDFERMFSSPSFRPDELKIYPCSLVESAELVSFYERGEWRPYTDHEVETLLQQVVTKTPRYCRLSRVMRDIPATDVVAGTKRSNLREDVERTLRDEQRTPKEIRSREPRLNRISLEQLQLRETPYATTAGEERFLEFVDPGDRVIAFLRLCLPTWNHATEEDTPEELHGNAVVRELHVYGVSLRLGQRESPTPQHQGLGRRLLERAAAIARVAGCRQLSVISAVGTRPYYRKRGFRDGTLYQHLALPGTPG